MEINKTNIELTSPAGSFESLMAAIQGGADSVYFGIENLNMRSRSANNFGIDDLGKISEICKENNIKSYLTLNTVIYNEDFGAMREIVDTARDNGISAIIASDMAVINYCKSRGVEVHLSTQANVSNIEAVKFYSDFADVIVLARELNLEQVRQITKAIEEEQIKGPSGNLLRIEIFIHGALCMAVSGKCYMSLHEKNHSANRGECLQTCRKSYIVTEKSSGYELEIDNERIMSPKDLCTIGFLDKILLSGAKVLKIEGRGRAPEYVKRTAECYSEAIQAYIEGTYTEEKIARWKDKLKTVFNRGFWDGYFLGRKMGEWSEKYGSSATKKKLYIGKATNYYAKNKAASFLIENNGLEVGDEILIIGPTSGVIESTITELRVEFDEVSEARKGDECSFPINDKVRPSDKLYKLIDTQIKENSL